MKTTRKHYEAPKTEVLEMESQGVFCVSGDAASAAIGGAGTNGMQNGGTYGW